MTTTETERCPRFYVLQDFSFQLQWEQYEQAGCQRGDSDRICVPDDHSSLGHCLETGRDQ